MNIFKEALGPDYCELCEEQGTHTDIEGQDYWLEAGPENDVIHTYRVAGLYRVCQDCYVDPAFKD